MIDWRPFFIIKVKNYSTHHIQEDVIIIKKYFDFLRKDHPDKQFYGLLNDLETSIFVKNDENGEFIQSRMFPSEITKTYTKDKEPSKELKQFYEIVISIIKREIEDIESCKQY